MILRNPGYAVFLSILCLIFSCLPFVSMGNVAEELASVFLYLYLLWFFLILNLFFIGRYCDKQPPDTGGKHDQE